LLNDILVTDNNAKYFYFTLWLNNILEKNQIVDKSNLGNFIQYVKTLNQSEKEKCVKAMGKVGQELALEISEFKRVNIIEGIEDWEQCDPYQRMMLLKLNREYFFNNVIKDWTNEKLSTKKAYIEVWKNETNDFEIEFLLILEKDEFAFKPNEKKGEKDIRDLIHQIFFQNNVNDYRNQIFMPFKKYIVNREISLPKSEDELFNKEFLSNNFTFNIKNDNPAYFASDIDYWFSKVLSFFPFRDWANAMGLSVEEAFKYFLDDNQFKVKIEGKYERVLENSLWINAVQYFDEEISLLHLKYCDHRYSLSLIQKLSGKSLQQFIISQDLFENEDYIKNWQEANGVWDYEFSTKLHTKVFKSVVEYDKPLSKSYFDSIAKFTHTKCEVLLNSLKEKITNTPASDKWLGLVYKQTMNSIELRKKIENY
jgi:hypothetical protein